MISEGATLAAAMTDLASGDWRSAADPGPLGWSCLPEFTRGLGTGTGLFHPVAGPPGVALPTKYKLAGTGYMGCAIVE